MIKKIDYNYTRATSLAIKNLSHEKEEKRKRKEKEKLWKIEDNFEVCIRT